MLPRVAHPPRSAHLCPTRPPAWLACLLAPQPEVAPSSARPSPPTHNHVPCLRVSPALQPEVAPSLNLEAVSAIFAPYGYVKKLVTYTKTEGGMLVWVQFPDANTAATVSWERGPQACWAGGKRCLLNCLC